MAAPKKQPRHNRYKKTENGKGHRTLAVFLVAMLVVLVASYYFFAWRVERTTPRQSAGQQSTGRVSAPSAVPEQRLTTGGTDADYYDNRQTGRAEGGEGGIPVAPPERSSAKPEEKQLATPELAIIIDDMGSSMQEARALAALGVPLTFAVIPGLRQDRLVAEFAAAQGLEVMLHMPMQSKEYPRRRLESNGLLLQHDNAQVQEQVEGYLQRIPQAVGANNHTGSAFTEDASKMRVVLSVLKRNNLFFIDSVTTPDTAGLKVATELRVRTARRDLFLDNEQNEAYIRGQFAKAVSRARSTGRAVAICHPYPATIATLGKLLPELHQREGIRLVSASRLVR